VRFQRVGALIAGVAAVGAMVVAVAQPAGAASGPVFTVMNTSETPPDGVYFRNSPNWNDTSRTYGLGAFMNEQVQLECYAFGQAIGTYNNQLWYYVLNVSRPVNYDGQPNQGMLNAHYINDGQAANVVDAGVPACVNNSPAAAASTPVVTLAQGPAVAPGYRYSITVSGFPVDTDVSVTCYDSVSPGGLETFTVTTGPLGDFSATACYSADGPDHWVVVDGIESNHVTWGGSSGNGGGATGSGGNGHVIINGIDVGIAQNSPHQWGSCTVQDFKQGPYGWVIVSYTGGTHMVRNGMLWGWFDNGGAPGFGCPQNDEHPVNGRVLQDFSKGTLYWVSGMNHAKRLRSYIAMGDSYSSGEANPPFDAGTDGNGDGCHRSSEAWPRILSRLTASGLNLVAHIACSGASTAAMTHTYNTEPPQLDQLERAPHADVITVTLGGNDLGFVSIIENCVVWQCDRDGVVSTAEHYLRHSDVTRMSVLGLLTHALQQIKAKSPASRVVLVGYPNIFPTSFAAQTHCAWLTRSERSALVQLATDLDAVSRDAAKAAGIEFKSLLQVLAGHEECTANSWMYPIASPGSATQYNGHPTALGQSAMANAVEAYLGS
jgi:lysophospholipase L1-like esterase